MFTSIKNIIDSRLNKGIVLDDFDNEHGHFIKINHRFLYKIVSFIKSDPDIKANLLDQIFYLTSEFKIWQDTYNDDNCFELVYQFKSIKLPYKVSIVIDIDPKSNIVFSISSLFIGASWIENDLKDQLGIKFETKEFLIT